MAGRRYDGPDIVDKALTRNGKIGVAAGVGAAGYSASPPGRRQRQKGRIAGLAYRSSPEFRSLPRAQRKAVVNDMYDRAQMVRGGVGKKLVDEETKTSPIRVAGLAGGMSAIAWGGSRLKYLGPALRAAKEMTEPVSPRTSRYFNQAERLRRGTERGTTGFGHAFGVGLGAFPRGVQAQFRRIPGDKRPLAATLVGAGVVHQSTPVRRKTYRPVVERKR